MPRKYARDTCEGMGYWTKQELLTLLEAWKAAYKAASTGKSYSIQGRTLTRYDLTEIRAQMAYLEQQLNKLNGKGGSVRVLMRVRR
ncbi:DUF6148 family protein [Oleidesulfovibrio sp.]|uniref:DUF6148 family protein n=1 Tax=Oleidesulfovibrio sp. TaxID=2909707 RepID=UPI003A877B0B